MRVAVATVAWCERVFRGRERGGNEYTIEFGVIDHVKNFEEVKAYIKSVFFIHTGLSIVLFEFYVWKSQSLGSVRVIFLLHQLLFTGESLSKKTYLFFSFFFDV